MLFLAGCGHKADHEGVNQGSASNQTDHSDKDSHTLYSENLELFVEFDPIVVGTNSAFNVHLTNLKQDYSPLTDANVVLTLEIDREVKQKFESRAGIPGIYKFEVSPQFAGEGKLIFDISATDISEQFELEHVHVFRETTDVHSHGHSEVTNQVTYTKEQAWSSDFNVEPATLKDFSRVIHASGELLAMPGEKQNMVAKNDGIVMFSTRNLIQGSPVNKGDLLFTISGKGFTDDNISVQYHEARLQFEKSKIQYQRHKNLVEDKIVSEGQFTESRNRYLRDSVAYYYLQRTVSDGGLKVHAPLKGYIHELNVSEGQFASTGTLLATISSNKVMLLRADVPQQFFMILGQISDATFRPAYTDKVYTIAELKGKLLAKASSVAENDHYMPVYFEVINDGTLLEGAFAEFNLKTEPVPDRLVVPVNALIEEQNNFYVYVQLSGENYLKQQLRLGDSDGIHAEVISGLNEGDRVVTRGALLLKASSASSAPVHSHSH